MDNLGGEQIEQGDNVLLYLSPFDGRSEAICLELLQVPSDENRAVLEVTYADSPGKRKAAWEHFAGDVPEEWVVVSVDSNQQNSSQRRGGSADRRPVVETVTGPGDLTAIGTRITDWLRRWDDQAFEPTVCLESISALFQYTGPELGLRFLDALTTEVSDVGALAHYHMDPHAHDDETREAIESRFDAVINPGQELVGD